MTDAPRLTDRKRDAILAAAIAEFRANGFEATSMDRIATRAEVSKRTVYNHFPSKDVLFADILVQLWNVSASERELAYRSDVPLRDQLRELLAAKLRMLNDTHLLDLARVAIAAAIHSPERAQNMVARLGEKEEGLLVWLRAAQDDGKLRGADPVFAAQQLHGMLKTFGFWPQVTMGEAPLSAERQEHIVAATIDMFLARYDRPDPDGSGRLDA
jgi:TetR/AcrR family transcriptional regulator of autoinduction and epiphytic fitness